MVTTSNGNAATDIATAIRIPVRMILIVGSLSAFGPLCVDMYLPALPSIKDGLHTSASLVQLSITACLLGMAAGQFTFGPLSDHHGRRRPLFIGMTIFVAASVACWLAPNILALIVLRFAQGFGGAAGVVISQAVVRDLYSGVAAARFFSLLMLVLGAGPIVAPQLGAGLLHLGSWRIIFVVLALAGTALIVIAVVFLPETHPSARRSRDGARSSFRAMKEVATNRSFLASAVSCGFAFGAIFAYIAGSSFVLENVYGLSPQIFSLVFGLNAVGLITASQVNARIVERYGLARMLAVGLGGLTISGVALLVLTALEIGGLAGVLGCMFVVLTSVGLILPNASALAMNDFPQSAGSTAALLGLAQFAIGAGLAPIVGVAGDHDALPMATVLCACALTASVVRILMLRGHHVDPNLHPVLEPRADPLQPQV